MRRLLIIGLIFLCLGASGQVVPGIVASSGVMKMNLALWSEQMDNAVYDHSSTSIVTNVGVDLRGNTTLDRVTLTSAYGAIDQEISGLTPGTHIKVSWEAIRGSQGSTAYYVVYDVTHGYTGITNGEYYASINGSTATRITIEFDIPAGCTAIDIVPYSATSINDNCILGGLWVYLPGRDYATTTSSQVL